MKLRPLFLMLLALCALAAPAWAATVLLADDAEGDITAKWVVEPPTNEAIQPWQKGNSTTPKVPRPTTTHEGSGSYWSGVSPPDNHPVDVIEGSSTMRTKEPIVIPADGKTTFSMWSFFQNEGDDLGQVDVALATSATAPGVKDKAWKKLTEYKLEPNAAGDLGKKGYCNPSDPATTASQEFEEVKGDFAAYAGKKVWVRIHLKYGGENRSATQACDWYVDDIKIETTGTPGKLGDAAAPATAPPAPSPSAPAKSSVKFLSFTGKGKKASVKLQITNGPVRNAVVTLLKGKKKVATARFKQAMDSGVNPVKFKLKKKLKKGTYVLKFKGTGADGSAVTASGRGKAR